MLDLDASVLSIFKSFRKDAHLANARLSLFHARVNALPLLEAFILGVELL